MEQRDSALLEPVLFQPQNGASDASWQALEPVYAGFARDLGMQLSAFLRFSITAKFEGVEETSFSQYLAARKPYGCAGLLSATRPDGAILIDLDQALVYGLLELLLGGKPGTGEWPSRPPTEIEKQLLSSILRTINSELQRALQAVSGLAVHFIGMPGASQLARTFPGMGKLVVARFEFTAGERSGSLMVLTPAQLVQALTEKAEHSAAALPDESPETMSNALLDAQVDVSVWLEDVSMQLRDVVGLKEGYIVKFDHTPERDLSCTLNGERGFMGQVVSTGRKRAFLIQKEMPLGLVAREAPAPE